MKKTKSLGYLPMSRPWKTIKRFLAIAATIIIGPSLYGKLIPGESSPPCENSHTATQDCEHYIRCVGGTYRRGPYMNLFECLYCKAKFWFDPKEPK